MIKVINKKHITIGVIVLLTFTIAWFIDSVVSFRHELRSETQRAEYRQVSADDIEAWMTYEYINFRFNLPDSYLLETLAIESKKYPKIKIKKDMLPKVIEAVKTFRAN